MALPADPTPRIVIPGRACVPGIHTHQPFRAYSQDMDGWDLRPGHDEHIEKIHMRQPGPAGEHSQA